MSEPLEFDIGECHFSEKLGMPAYDSKGRKFDARTFLITAPSEAKPSYLQIDAEMFSGDEKRDAALIRAECENFVRDLP